MKKLLFLLLFLATATLAQAQVSKMLGQWNTFDDKTGDMRSTVRIYEESGTYQAKTDELILRGSLDKAGLLGRSQTWKRKK